MMIDMGAGTTELSINHVNERGADQRVLCYQDRSVLLGGDDFNRPDQGNPQATHGAATQQDRLLQRLEKAHREVWYLGYQKDAGNHVARCRWRELRVLLLGGGVRRPEVAHQIEHSCPMLPWPLPRDRIYEIAWHRPVGIHLPPSLPAEDRKDIPLLAVANGLSIERQRWPEVFPPGEIEVAPPTARIDRPEPFSHIGGK